MTAVSCRHTLTSSNNKLRFLSKDSKNCSSLTEVGKGFHSLNSLNMHFKRLRTLLAISGWSQVIAYGKLHSYFSPQVKAKWNWTSIGGVKLLKFSNMKQKKNFIAQFICLPVFRWIGFEEAETWRLHKPMQQMCVPLSADSAVFKIGTTVTISHIRLGSTWAHRRIIGLCVKCS